MTRILRSGAALAWLSALLLPELGITATYQKIVIAESAHPAVQSAAQMLARSLGLPPAAVQAVRETPQPTPGVITLTTGNLPDGRLKHDGYTVAFRNGGAQISGARPRSLLYAAADFRLWKDRSGTTFMRDPSFAVRAVPKPRQMSMAEAVATLGVNTVIAGRAPIVSLRRTLPEVYGLLSEFDQRRLDQQEQFSAQESARVLEECKAADVTCYTDMPYGNNFSRWSPALYQAALKAYPAAKGTPATTSWEKAALCPSDPGTWKLFDAYVREMAEQAGTDGLYATFWDEFGIYCQCERCKRSGLDRFPNELYLQIKHYNDVLSSMGKRLMLRTWSSGAPHWLSNEWVHAPGQDGFSGLGDNLWSRVIKELPASITLQTKVYSTDCEPDARFNTLLGKAKPHTELVEYQITGQTVGRFYFPASTVDYMAATMKKAFALVGPEGGSEVGPGGTQQSNYSPYDDILNSINVYAWRELTWDVSADVNKIWNDWAARIYSPGSASHIIKALRLSEEATNRTFSPLGFGTSTNSDFAGNIARREALLKYTNRYFLPESAKYLEPTKANIQRLVEEKTACAATIEQMFRELELAKPHLSPEQAGEIATRFDWLREFFIVNRALEESLWRFRYVRYLNGMLTSDPEQMKYLAEAYDSVTAHKARLFRYDPSQKFSCYDRPLGELQRKPALGDPLPLMKELYDKSRTYLEEAIGPDFIAAEWKR
jgi:hypothetical protein